MSPILGCIADDFTGASDLANTLVRGGLRTVQLIGVPGEGTVVPDADAVVMALKSRTISPGAAVAQSLAALKWLQAAGCRQYFFKYCSTFDSTDEGNIGPVTEALMKALECDFTIACPAFPDTGRSIFKGHLFVGDQLLSDSSMRNHPLTPMTDSDLVAVLQRQTTVPVGLTQFADVNGGAETVEKRFATLRADGIGISIVDAISDDHLTVIGRAARDLKLITGGSGIALGLPENYRTAGLVGAQTASDTVPQITGLSAVLSGSCSAATLGQVEEFAKDHPAFRVDPLALARGDDVVGQALDWLSGKIKDGPALIYASAAPEEVKQAQSELGRAEAGDLIEQAMGKIARSAVDSGVRRLVVAGGETSGAVVEALGISGLQIGAQIDPGVPGCVTIDDPNIALALKSGNFGTPDFFAKALRQMP